MASPGMAVRTEGERKLFFGANDYFGVNAFFFFFFFFF